MTLRGGGYNKSVKNRVLTVATLFITVILGIAAVVYMLTQEVPEANKGTTERGARYVSLGDSVASGLGLTTPADTTGCGRTKEAYPYLLATALDYQLTHLACTGATLEAGINGPQVAAGEQTSQLTALFQREPDLITLGIGANDVAWLSLLSRCLEIECGTDEDQAAYEQVLNERVKPQLRTVLEAIDKQYGKKTQLVVVGYYQVFPRPGAMCQDISGLDDKGLVWARELRARLNRTVYEVVRTTGVGRYVEIDFSGHELCTNVPWIQGLSDPAPYHANAAGQRAIAEQIEKFLKR